MFKENSLNVSKEKGAIMKWRNLAALLIAAPAMALAAGGSSGITTIKTIHIDPQDSTVRIVGNSAFSNPDGCGQSDAVVISTSDPWYKDTLAALMMAFSTQTPVQFWIAGCLNTPWGYTEPHAIHTYVNP
jgi:amino acid transporter